MEVSDVEILELIGKGLAAAGVAMALNWATIEWLLPGVKSKQTKRLLSFALGIGAVLALQEAHFVHFGMDHDGNDVHNWVAAVLFGVMAGGLTPLFHQHVISRFAPALKKKGGNDVL